MACLFMAYTQARTSEEMDRTLPKFTSFENKYEAGGKYQNWAKPSAFVFIVKYLHQKINQERYRSF